MDECLDLAIELHGCWYEHSPDGEEEFLVNPKLSKLLPLAKRLATVVKESWIKDPDLRDVASCLLDEIASDPCQGRTSEIRSKASRLAEIILKKNDPRQCQVGDIPF